MAWTRRLAAGAVLALALALAGCGDDGDGGVGISRAEFVDAFALTPEERAEAECIYDELAGTDVDLGGWVDGVPDLTPEQDQRLSEALIECFRLDDLEDLDDLDEG